MEQRQGPIESLPEALPSSSILDSRVQHGEDSRRPAPDLLVQWTPRWRVFLRNLADLFLPHHGRRWEPGPPPAPFWTDVFVEQGFPARGLWRSALYHAFAITVLWGFSQTGLVRSPVPLRDPFANSRLTYYPVSEYLPPLDTGETESAAAQAQKGDPEQARQRIISTPLQADNRTQTIVTPSPLKIARDVPLPNLIAWTPRPAPPQPMLAAEAITRTTMAVPLTAVAVVAPPPTVATAKLYTPVDLLPAPIEPPPPLDQLRTGTQKISEPGAIGPPAAAARTSTRSVHLPVLDVIGPPPAVPERKLGELNVARFGPQVASPAMPLPEQQVLRSAPSAGALVLMSGGKAPGQGVVGGAAQAAAAAPSATLQGISPARVGGAFISLGLHPATPMAPLQVPEGNRRGTFAATPEGRHGASGMPEIRHASSGGNGAGGTRGEGGSGTAGRDNHGLPAGLQVSGGAVNPGPSAAAGRQSPVMDASARKVLLAAARPPRLADLARQATPIHPIAPVEPGIEEKVFGPRKYYSMTLNMPNLTSAGGSWVIRFAQLHEDGTQGELTAPVALLKVDPAYPPELMRARVEGTVTLYAVIRRDGSVAEVRVLHGLDERLDANARAALARWHFRPGTKNGSAVDLEAVVQIPFQARRLPPF